VAGLVASPDPMLAENWEESVELLLDEDPEAALAACATQDQSDWQLHPATSCCG